MIMEKKRTEEIKLNNKLFQEQPDEIYISDDLFSDVDVNEKLVINNPIHVEPIFIDDLKAERKRKEKQSKAIAKINGEKLPAEEVSFAASAKGKIVIVAYVVALLTVLFFLATTLNSISMLKTDILTLNAAIAAETENVRELTNVANTDNREELIAAAEELGYTNEGNSEVRNIVLADILPEEETYESTNWFDKLCDWLIGD